MTSEPPTAPTAVGVKLSRLVQDAPGASVAAVELDESCGQVELLSIVNPAAMLGFKPATGTGKVSAAFPILVTVTVCELPVEPTAVDAKVRLGASAKSSFTSTLLLTSATKTLPVLSTATPSGP